MRTKFIAVTGGIGSGKSTAIKIISDMGYKVISADEVYKELLSDKDFILQLNKIVGIYSDAFNRKIISDIVFQDRQKLESLNAFTHQKIMDKMFEKSIGERVVFHEVPLLFEGGFKGMYNQIMVIMRDKNARIEAVCSRSNLTREEVENRINNQVNYDALNLENLTVIYNDGDLEAFSKKVKNAVLKLV